MGHQQPATAQGCQELRVVGGRAQAQLPGSGYNVPGVSGAEPELLALVTRSFRALWAAAGGVNPGYFGEVTTVP